VSTNESDTRDRLPGQRLAGFSHPPAIAEPDGRLASDGRRLHFNESAYPPSPAALAAMTAAVAETSRYPDHGCSALRQRLSRKNDVAEDRISFGNGSTELLAQIARISIAAGDEAIVPAPTFPTCAESVVLSGGTVVSVPVTEEGYNDVIAMLAAITDKTRLFYLCTPNNPTGTAIPADLVRRAATEVPDNCMLAIDEAYFEFSSAREGDSVLDILKTRTGPWVITRSFSKAYGLAGMRVGYAFTSDAELCTAFWNLRTSFNINRVALAGTAAALDDEDYLADVLHKTTTERGRLFAGLESLGFKPFQSEANFVTCRSVGPAARFVKALAGKGIMISAMQWPDENGCLRIGVGGPDDTTSVLEGLKEVLATSS
jgi:histidinol-phosphate aminotransferase